MLNQVRSRCLGLGDNGSLTKVRSIDAAGDLGNGMSAVNSVSVYGGTLASRY